MTTVDEIKKFFLEAYGASEQPIHCFFCPGRVNLIGEHIDFNGGYVFPAALSLGIYGAIRVRTDHLIQLKSLNAGLTIKVDVDKEILYDERDGWGNYPKGIIKYLISQGQPVNGCDVYYAGDLPDGAGLSSSAALEVLTGYMLQYQDAATPIDRVALAKLSQAVENQFVNMNCGIMDQFSVAMGQKDNAILLDCETLDYKLIPFVLKGHSLIIMNTNKKRELAASKYNERRAECEQALAMIKKHKNIKNLCEASLEDVESLVADKVLAKRARHVVSENQRVLSAVQLLTKGDLSGFGQLMIGSHMSLKNDYEVTGFQLDTIVAEALKAQGCIGARMTGAGFGGCAIALVENSHIDEFTEKVAAGYKRATGLTPAFYVSVIGDGVKFIG